MSGRIFAPLRVVLALAAVVSIAGFRSTPPKVADVDWRYYGQSTDETHYSPLAQITPDNIGRLKLWAVANVPASSGASMPLAVDGVVYVALGLSHVYAVEAATGKTLWTYDPEVGRVAGMKLRYAWGIRGLAYADGKVIVGAQDGRLIALDAKSGALAWSVDTTAGQPDLYITGAPRVMGDKVIIGNGGADTGLVRGYVSAYEVATGKPAWRFYTVPGDPAKPPENRAMQIAAPTWSSESFRYGGGGTAWNAMTYDAERGRI